MVAPSFWRMLVPAADAADFTAHHHIPLSALHPAGTRTAHRLTSLPTSVTGRPPGTLRY